MMLVDYLISTEWDHCYISNIDELLEKNKLHEGLVRSSIKLLNSYLSHSKEHSLILNLGGCRIEVQGTEQAVAIARSLMHTLEKHF